LLPLFLLGLLLALGLSLALRGFLAANAGDLVWLLRMGGFGLAGAVALVLIATGRLGLVAPLALLALPALRHWWRVRKASAGARALGGGRTSELETRTLRMVLDHDSGTLDGEVRCGPWAGRRLSELALGQLMALVDHCRQEDPPSSPVLEAWLDRTQGPDWRAHSTAAHDNPEAGPAAAGGPMTRSEALSILGLAADASPQAVKEAHHRLMALVHPDHGGTSWLAAKLNQARDLLLH
jgi:hypothetical protein